MRLFLLILTALLATNAHAQSTTEYFHQPAGGASEVTAHVGYETSTYSYKGSSTGETNFNGLDHLGVKYEYGLNPLLALGADLSYSTFKQTNNASDLNGIEPLRVILDGQLPMAMGTLEYGLIGSIGIEKAQNKNKVTNRSYGDLYQAFPAGGFKLAPYLGYAFALGSSTSFLGLRASYDAVSTDVKADVGTGTDANLAGGNAGQFALFFEGKAADMPLGLALTYDFFAKTTIETGSGANDIQKSHSLIGGKFYADMPFGGGTDFLPSLVWREKASGDDFDKTSDIRFNIAGRFAF